LIRNPSTPDIQNNCRTKKIGPETTEHQIQKQLLKNQKNWVRNSGTPDTQNNWISRKTLTRNGGNLHKMIGSETLVDLVQRCTGAERKQPGKRVRNPV